jgi:hypothetical protein
LFEGIYRERRNPNKLFNTKTNPIIKKIIKLKTTKNRALKNVSTLIDNKTIRSMQLNIIGKTTKTMKEIKSPNLKKFRLKKTQSSPILKFVEKSKYAIDTVGEKRELKVSRVKKRKK